MNANLQPNNELDQTTPVNNETPQTTDVIQDTDSQTIAKEASLEAAETIETSDDMGSDSPAEEIAATTAQEAAPAEVVADTNPTEPQDKGTIDATNETASEVTNLTPTEGVEPSTNADFASTATSPATELELTAERPALTEEDQEYYGFAVKGSPGDGVPTTPLWERIAAVTSPAERSKVKRLATVALVCAVAVVSFVAGGLTSRLSSQMPILFGHGEETQSVASYTPHMTQRDTEDADDPSATTTTDTQANPRETDARTTTKDDGSTDKYTTTTDKDSTSDSKNTGDSKNKTTRDKNSTKDDSDSYTDKWYFNTDGDESISYDSDKDTYTIDYDGYTLTVPTDEFFDDEIIERWYSPYGDSDMYDYYYDYGYGYGDETGYDTEEDRDRRSWGGQSDEGTSNGWGDSEDQNDSGYWNDPSDYPFFGWEEFSA